MPIEYAEAVRELVQAKIEQRAPEVEIGTERREATRVVNIMDALKKIRVLNPIQVNGHWVPSLWGYDATQGGDTASHEDVTVED